MLVKYDAEIDEILDERIGEYPICQLCSTIAIYEITSIHGQKFYLCPNHDLNKMELLSCDIITVDTNGYQFPIRDDDYLARRSERRIRYGRCVTCGT